MVNVQTKNAATLSELTGTDKGIVLYPSGALYVVNWSRYPEFSLPLQSFPWGRPKAVRNYGWKKRAAYRIDSVRDFFDSNTVRYFMETDIICPMYEIDNSLDKLLRKGAEETPGLIYDLGCAIVIVPDSWRS